MNDEDIKTRRFLARLYRSKKPPTPLEQGRLAAVAQRGCLEDAAVAGTLLGSPSASGTGISDPDAAAFWAATPGGGFDATA